MSARDAIIDEIKTAPESLVREAYDFILFSNSGGKSNPRPANRRRPLPNPISWLASKHCLGAGYFPTRRRFWMNCEPTASDDTLHVALALELGGWTEMPLAFATEMRHLPPMSMLTLTPTAARGNLSELLRRALKGDDIGIVVDGIIVALLEGKCH